MAKLFATFSRSLRPYRWLATLLVLVGVMTVIGLAQAPQYARCQGAGCLCVYCDDTQNGVCMVYAGGVLVPGGPIGCSGACAYNDQQPWLPGTCSDGGRGGCGADVKWCRSSDCGAGAPEATRVPPTATPQPRPTPVVPPTCPALGEVREWTNIIPPKIGSPEYRPPYPVVIEQDPNKAGFEIHLTFDGGRYEYKTQRLEQWCGPDSAGESQGRYGVACTGDVEWHYECPIRCTECYDDPLDGAQIRMRLADSTVEWIQGELQARYPGAKPQEGLPRTWQIVGTKNRMHYDAWWRYAPGKPDILSNGPLDPGIHGGKIALWTLGTPKSGPQLVERAFEVQVYLMDTTIAK